MYVYYSKVPKFLPIIYVLDSVGISFFAEINDVVGSPVFGSKFFLLSKKIMKYSTYIKDISDSTLLSVGFRLFLA